MNTLQYTSWKLKQLLAAVELDIIRFNDLMHNIANGPDGYSLAALNANLNVAPFQDPALTLPLIAAEIADFGNAVQADEQLTLELINHTIEHERISNKFTQINKLRGIFT